MTTLPEIERVILGLPPAECERPFAMTGVTKRRNRISGRLYSAFASHLKGGPCDAYVSDVKVKLRVNRDIHAYYPDVMVVCGRGPKVDRYVADPKLVVEVLSTSTAGVDRHSVPSG